MDDGMIPNLTFSIHARSRGKTQKKTLYLLIDKIRLGTGIHGRKSGYRKWRSRSEGFERAYMAYMAFDIHLCLYSFIIPRVFFISAHTATELEKSEMK